jgi:hypothetical protein
LNLLVTLAVEPIVPEMTDTLTIDGKAETIKKIVQLRAVGVPVAFKIVVRGGALPKTPRGISAAK